MSSSIFADSPPKPSPTETRGQEKWKVLIVDDDVEVHQVTKLALRNFQFMESQLEFISAYSGKEAREILTAQSDIAVTLLDVVMEDETAGLDTAKFIRDELNNRQIRIILRTGQPGHAPEEIVVRDYDINDYKDKSELTTVRLTTVMYSALRSYRSMIKIKKQREALARTIESASKVFEAQNIKDFSSAMLEQITNIIDSNHLAIYCTSFQTAPNSEQLESFDILATAGDNKKNGEVLKSTDIPIEIKNKLLQTIKQEHRYIGDDCYIGYYVTSQGATNLLYIPLNSPLTSEQLSMLEVYGANVAITYETLLIKKDILDTQKELILLLSESVEQLSKETGFHVKRVAEASKLMALKVGLDKDHAEQIRFAAPLHDIGKILIPDDILNKPGKHSDDEFSVMKTHAQKGSDLLSESQKELLLLAARIAAEHHEKWDGSGYPRGLKGNDISIEGRIVSLVDVFDALGSKRCYKEPWPLEKIKQHIQDQSGKHFDPKLTDILLENWNEFTEIRENYPDKESD